MRPQSSSKKSTSLKAVAFRLVLGVGLGVGFGVSSADPSQDVLQAARTVIGQTAFPSLITIDSGGQPKARVVDAFPPDEDFVVWVATRPSTRKVSEIRGNSKVTLHYFSDDHRNYVSIMGEATLIEDTKTKQTMRRASDTAKLYPEFPKDYLLLRIQPQRLEGVLPGYRGDPLTWQPVGVDFPH